MTPEALKERLRLHAMWLRSEEGGIRADMSGASLSGADMSGADMRGAYLRGANLRGADMRGAYLRGADLIGADMSGADMRCADLSGADMSGADMRCADMRCADMSGASLIGADLSDADMIGADMSGAKGVIRIGPASDGCEFFGVLRDGVVWIKAGCRWFTADDARKHWQATRADTPLGRERLRFVDFIEAHFKGDAE